MSYESAWFMAHRIREAMSDDAMLPAARRPRRAPSKLTRPTGATSPAWRSGAPGTTRRRSSASWSVAGTFAASTSSKVNEGKPQGIMQSHIDPRTRIMTDEASYYDWTKHCFALSRKVAHLADEYSRGDVTTNTIEGFFSIVKRGLDRHVPPCGRQAPVPVSRRVRLPLQHPRPHGLAAHVPRGQGHRWKASDLSRVLVTRLRLAGLGLHAPRLV